MNAPQSKFKKEPPPITTIILLINVICDPSHNHNLS